MDENILQPIQIGSLANRTADVLRQPLRIQTQKSLSQSTGTKQTPQRKVLVDITNKVPGTKAQHPDKGVLGKRKLMPLSTKSFEIFEDGEEEECEERLHQRLKQTTDIPPSSSRDDEIENMHIPPVLPPQPITLTHWDEEGRPIDVIISVEHNLHKLVPTPTCFSGLQRSRPKKKQVKKNRKATLLASMPPVPEDLGSQEDGTTLIAIEPLPSIDWDTI